MMATRLAIVGLPDGERALLASLLEGWGYDVAPPHTHTSRTGPAVAGPLLLTRRQVQVLGALRTHGEAKAAARALGMSERTFEWHLQRIYTRLGVRERICALCWACRCGLLDGEWCPPPVNSRG